MDASAKNLKRNLLFNTGGNLIYFACQWLVTGYFVNRLAALPDAGLYNGGLLNTAMAVTNVFLTLASFGMRTFQVSDVADKYSQRTYIASRLLTIGASVALCAVYTAALGYGGEQAVCIGIYLFYKLLESLTDVFHGCCQKRERMDVIGVSYAARGVLTVGVFCVVYAATGRLVPALLAMTALCWLFSLWYDVWRARPYYAGSPRAPFSRVWALLLECLPLVIYSFCNTAASSIPKLALERIHGTSVMGLYSYVNSPVLILQVGVAFLFTPFITMFANKLAAGDKHGFRRIAVLITLGVFGVGTVGIGGVLLLGRWGLNLLYGEAVAAQAGLLVPMVVCAVLTSLVLFYCMLLTVLRDMKGLILGNLAGLAVSAAVSVPLVTRLALFGASYAAMLALAVQCVALAVFGLRSLGRYGAEKRS